MRSVRRHLIAAIDKSAPSCCRAVDTYLTQNGGGLCAPHHARGSDSGKRQRCGRGLGVDVAEGDVSGRVRGVGLAKQLLGDPDVVRQYRPLCNG